MKRSLFIATLLALSLSTSAQKLPNIQENSLRAPANIKVDGKATEWNNQFQAYNKSTGIFYTVSNDNDKLYLAVRITDLDIANKIMYAGLTFLINSSGKAKDEGGMGTIFPFFYQGDISNSHRFSNYESEALSMNQILINKGKDIRVAGIKGVKDTISIYNPEGIRAAAFYGEDMVFFYELAIPLKYLGLSVNQTKPFVYTIKLNGTANYFDTNEFNKTIAARHVRFNLKEGMKIERAGGDNIVISGPNAAIVTALISPTYFSGKLILAK